MTEDTSPTGRRGNQPPSTCAFCGRAREEVRFLNVSYTGAAICDVCVQTTVKAMGDMLGQDERMSFEPPHYLFPYSLVARLWAASAAVADTVMTIDGWKPIGHEPTPHIGPTVATAKLPEQLREVVRAARGLAKYYVLAEDIIE